jgi:ubiquinone/menaquinone biosynthesis C-methylase UbiE
MSPGEYHQPGVLRVLQNREETRCFYNKIAGVYDLLADRAEQPVRQMALEMLDARPGERILEIGFGTGHSLIDLARAVGTSGKVYGIDLSEKMARIARRRVRNAGLQERIEIVCGDALHLPQPDGSVDGVFMCFTLELFDTPEIPDVLSECRRVLRDTGRLVVAGMSRLTPKGLIREAFEWTHRHFPNYLDCRPILVRQALEDANFRITGFKLTKMWVDVEIVRGVGERPRSGPPVA